MHAESSSVSWALVAQSLGPGDPERSPESRAAKPTIKEVNVMKSVNPKFAILAVAFATVTGIVVARPPTRLLSTAPIPDARYQTTTIDRCNNSILGKVLFENVTSVHFSGVDMPANSDGSFGGWVLEDAPTLTTQMTIYENFIVQEMRDPDGTAYRVTRSYDKLGRIEQRISGKAEREPNAK